MQKTAKVLVVGIATTAFYLAIFPGFVFSQNLYLPSSGSAAGAGSGTIGTAPTIPYGGDPSVSTSNLYAPPGGYAAPSGLGATDPTGIGLSAPAGQFAPGSVPGYAPSATTPGAVGAGVYPGAVAVPEGYITPPEGFNPYAVPGDSGGLYEGFNPFILPSYEDTTAQLQRFREALTFEYDWMPGASSDEFGIHDFDFQAKFAFPRGRVSPTAPGGQEPTGCSSWFDAPVFVSPGFGLHLWSGPHGQKYDLPSRVYDAYIDTEWNPTLAPQLAAELQFRIGVYSDFEKLTNQAIRYTGRGVGVLTLRENYAYLKGGIIYYDREHIQLLPTAGIVVTPSPDVRLELVFPDPRLAFRLKESSVDTTEYWLYFQGEYGGGSWAIHQPEGVVETDYNDIRIGVGIACDNKAANTLDSYFEIGCSCARELYSKGEAWMHPNPTVYLGAGLRY